MRSSIRYLLICKAHGNVSRHVVSGHDTVANALSAALAECTEGGHFSKAGYEIERVEIMRSIINPSHYL